MVRTQGGVRLTGRTSGERTRLGSETGTVRCVTETCLVLETAESELRRTRTTDLGKRRQSDLRSYGLSLGHLDKIRGVGSVLHWWRRGPRMRTYRGTMDFELSMF